MGSPVEGFLNSAKNGFATTHLGTTQISYDATGADKLVVAIGTEAGNNGQKVNSVSMSFNGIAMTAAVLENTMTPAAGQAGAYDGGYAGIFYLDNPFQGPANFTFSASTSSGAPNGAHVTIIGLAGTKPGVGQYRRLLGDSSRGRQRFHKSHDVGQQIDGASRWSKTPAATTTLAPRPSPQVRR